MKIKELPNIHAWTRFGARYIDLLSCGFILGALSSGNIDYSRGMLNGLIVLLLWTVVEPFLLSTFGYTLGKFILGVKVRDALGKRLTLYAAIKRSFRVLLYGFGLGFPLLWVYLFYSEYVDLRKEGVTTWDKFGNLSVSYEKIGFIRYAIIILMPIFVVIIFILPIYYR